MADKDTMTAVRNLRKHPHFDVEKVESGKFAVWYKEQRVGTLSETPGDRKNLLIQLQHVSRMTGLNIDRKGRINGTRVKVVQGRGAGTPPVLVMPAEMGSELDGEEATLPPKRQVDLTPPSGPVVSSGKRHTGRPTLQYEPVPEEASPPEPAKEDQVVEPCPQCETPGLHCAVHAPPPRKSTTAPATSTATEETPSVPTATEERRPGLRSDGKPSSAGRQKKRPSLKPEDLAARRDLVVDYLFEHPGETFSPRDITDMLSDLGVDMSISGVLRMLEVLHKQGRIKHTKQGRMHLFYVNLDDRPLRRGSTTPEAPQPAAQPRAAAPTLPPEVSEAARKPATSGAVAPPEEEPATMPESEPTPQPAAASATNNGHHDTTPLKVEAFAISELQQRIQDLERELMAVTLAARMKGITEDDLKLARDIARSMQ